MENDCFIIVRNWLFLVLKIEVGGRFGVRGLFGYFELIFCVYFLIFFIIRLFGFFCVCVFSWLIGSFSRRRDGGREGEREVNIRVFKFLFFFFCEVVLG